MRTATTTEARPVSPRYPFLGMSNIGDGLIVLFSEDSKGVVVDAGNSPHDLGKYKTGWVMSSFDRFDGAVTLSND